MQVRWTETALAQLDDIHGQISRSSPTYARRMVDRLTRRTVQISSFPLSGRIVPEFSLPQLREVIEGPYRILYQVLSDHVDVIAIVHVARNVLREEDP